MADNSSGRNELTIPEHTLHQIANLIEQTRAPATDQLKAGNELTLSLFSELQHSLGAPSMGGQPVQQRLPVFITTDNYLIMTTRPPRWADTMRLVLRGGRPEQPVEIKDDGSLPLIADLECEGPLVIAAKFAEGSGPGAVVRQVSFVTHVAYSIEALERSDTYGRSDLLDR